MARVTFKTASRNNSIYTVDTDAKTIEGGVLPCSRYYTGPNPAFLVGSRVSLTLVGGGAITTSPIEEVLGVDRARSEQEIER